MFFKKKEVKAKIEAAIEIKPIVFKCEHKWKDFGIFRTYTVSGEDEVITLCIKKLYGCIWCKEERIEDLYSARNTSADEINKNLEEIKKGLNVEHQAVVRNRLKDFQLVDKDYLEIARKCYPNRGI